MNTVTRHGIEVDLSYEHKTACPWCITKGRDRSGDNLHVYGLDEDSEHLGAKCFSCGAVIPSVKWLRDNKEITLEEMEYELVSTEFNDEVHEGIKSITTTNGKGYRGISEEANKFFGVRYEYNQEDGSLAAMYTPNTKGVLKGVPLKDALCGYGIRKMPKRFSCVGESGKDVDLFGAFRYLTHKGTVLLCAGQVDLLSAYTMLKQDYDKRGNKQFEMAAVVSPTNGEGSVAQIKNHYEYFSQFSKIIVVYDNDEAGRVATEAVAQVLPKGKVYTFPLRYKDVNEYLVNGKEKEFIHDFFTSLNRQYTPDGIYASSGLYEEALKYATVDKLSLPPVLRKVEDMFGKIVTGEIFLAYGDTSVGKSLFTDTIVEHWIMNEPNHTVGILSLEADKSKYATNLMARHLGVNLNRMEGEERVDFLKRPEIKERVEKFLQKPTGESRFYVYDNRGTSLDSVKNSILEMIKKLSVTIIVIDVISDLYMHLSLQEQDEFVNWLKSLTLEFPNVTIMVVAHTRKRDINAQITEQDIIGSSILAKSAAQTFSLERNKLEECPIKRNTTVVTVQKNRHGQSTGIASRIYFNPADGTLNDIEDFKKENPHLFMEE